MAGTSEPLGIAGSIGYRSPDGCVTVVSGKLGNGVRSGIWREILRQTGIRYRKAEELTRKYSLAIEGELGGYSAYVPELPAILVTGESLDELTARASEAILRCAAGTAFVVLYPDGTLRPGGSAVWRYPGRPGYEPLATLP
jgi:predicted RNase H-like HicB family nuclease